MHTVVLFDKAGKEGSLNFEANASIFNGFVPIKIVSLYKGTLTFETSSDNFTNIFEVSHIVAGCFHQNSNLYGIKRVKFILDGITLCITEKNAIPEKIEKLYYEKLNNMEAI